MKGFIYGTAKAWKIFLAMFTSIFLFTSTARAYSVLTHEAIVDASWKTSIEPALISKYPTATSEQLTEAHSFAYGGSIIPDIGYFPFGSKTFTNLLHYVRSGDFVKALIEESENLDEYAFALGVMAHYMGDNYGHEIGTNVAVPLVYPKVRSKFGNRVTYAQDHKSHSRMEFGFDVLQIARGNYASQEYHNFIGFDIAESVLEKAFFRTYGLDLHEVFGSFPVAVASFRWSVKSLIPTIARSAWIHKKDDILKNNPGAKSKDFSYRMKRRMYYQKFGKDNRKAGFFPTIIAWITPVLPKIGPLAKLKFKAPPPEAEKLFIGSFDSVLVNYSSAVANVGPDRSIDLANKCLDNGHITESGDYSITDDSYDRYLLKLYSNNFRSLKPEVTSNLVRFYKNRDFKNTKKKKSRKQRELSTALAALRTVSITPYGRAN